MDLQELYRMVIMDHYKNPHNKGLVDLDGYKKLHLNNPSCGDDMTVEVKLNGDVIEDIRQDGHGCSICCSSASVMSELLKGKTKEEATKLVEKFYAIVTGASVDNEDELEEALAYKGVSQFPARVKCATLAWKAFERAIKEE
ncbi:MAG: SUF system NifU family Fe-S cluster assembly protein [Clostridium sp.]|nr:MAG: SUF system NifU family Fe-S cluster assembly protein [Clostridium sp.]